MTMHSNYHRVLAVNALVPQDITTSAANSGDEDLFGFNGAEIVVAPGTIDGLGSGSPTAGSITVKVEHADDDGTGSADSYSNVAAADIVGATPSSGIVHTFDEDNTGIFQCSYVGDKRFIKVTLTPSGLGSGGPITVLLLKTHGRHQSVQSTQV